VGTPATTIPVGELNGAPEKVVVTLLPVGVTVRTAFVERLVTAKLPVLGSRMIPSSVPVRRLFVDSVLTTPAGVTT
jgi:hypothetical protein